MKWPGVRPMSIPLVTVLTMSVYMPMAAEAHEIRGFPALAAMIQVRAAPAAAYKPEGAMQINSKAISSGGEFPKRNTCDGADLSPDLAWSQFPPGAKSLALVLDDPDAPGGTFTHWILFNLPPAVTHLPESLDKKPEMNVGIQGRNDFGKVGYGGPCPPPGKPHRYFFRLYALDTVLGLQPGQPRRADLDRAIHGHVLAEAELMARYGR